MGSDVRTPGVSAQPGCMACTTTPEPARRCAHSRVSTTSARFVRAYATVPSNVPRSICRSSTCRRCVYIPPDVTLTIRDGALLRSRPSSSFVNRNGAATLVANVSSSPSAVTVRCAGSTPALLTSTSSRGSRARNSAANRRTSPRSLRSHRTTSTSLLPVRSTTCARASSPRSAPRASSRTLAPRPASPVAAARPRPEVARSRSRRDRPSARARRRPRRAGAADSRGSCSPGARRRRGPGRARCPACRAV